MDKNDKRPRVITFWFVFQWAINTCIAYLIYDIIFIELKHSGGNVMEENVLEAIALFMVAAVTGIVGYFLNRNSQKDFYETRIEVKEVKNSIKPVVDKTDQNVNTLLEMKKKELHEKETLEKIGFDVPNTLKSIESMSSYIKESSKQNKILLIENEKLKNRNKELEQMLYEYQQQYDIEER